MAERCPTCRRILHGKIYPNREERMAEIREKQRAAAIERAEVDRASLFPLLPAVFGTSDVSEACRRIGRIWSGNGWELTRWVQFGMARPAPAIYRGRQRRLQWEKVQGAEV